MANAVGGGATFYPNIDDDKTRFLRNGLHGEFESVWGTIQGPYDITFILKEKACQNRKLATYIRDLRDKNPQVASTVLILGSCFFAFILGGSLETWMFIIVLDLIVILCTRYIEFLFPIYFEPLIADTKKVSIYKNMDLEELRKLLRSLYWAFKTTDKWPQWVKNKDGTKAYPFSALVMNPETFCNDENDEVCSIIYIYIYIYILFGQPFIPYYPATSILSPMKAHCYIYIYIYINIILTYVLNII